MSEIKLIRLNSKVRVLYGEHAGKYAQVVGIAESGHRDHDLVALRFPGLAESKIVHSPVFMFRFALEHVSDPAPASWGGRGWVGSLSDTATTGPGRIRRFKQCDRVRVCNRAMARFGEVGVIFEVKADPPVLDFVGRSEGPFHAQYLVQFEKEVGFNPYALIVFHRETFWDWELAPEKTNA